MSFRRDFRRFVAPLIDGESVAELPAITDMAVRWMSEDPERMNRCLEELIRPIVYEMVQKIVSETRRPGIIVLGDSVHTKEALQQKAQAMRSRWTTHMEHSGDRHVRLMEASKMDLFQAANERYALAAANRAYGDLWVKMASAMEDGQKVRDRFTAADIDSMFRAITGEESA